MSRSRSRSRAATYMWGTGLALGALVAVAGVGFFAYVANRAKGVPGLAEQARNAGLAVSLTDLAVEADPGHDAFPKFKEASELLSKSKRSSSLRAYGNEVLSFRGGRAVEVGVEQNKRATADAWALLDRLDTSRDTQMSVRPEGVSSTKRFPVGATLELFVLTHSAEAIIAGLHGEPSRAALNLQRAIYGRNLLRFERGYPSFLRQMWSEIRIQRALVRLLQTYPDDPNLRAFAEDVQERLGQVPSVKWHLGGELALVLDAIQHRKRETIEDLPMADIFKEMGRGDVMRIFTQAVQSLPDDATQTTGLDRVFKEMDRQADEAPIYGGYAKGYRLMEFSLKDLLVRRRLFRSAMTVWDRVRRGERVRQLPESLGDWRIDPQTNRPFRLVETPTSLVIYSVGRDGIDDGGSEEPPKQMDVQTRDVIFAIPRSSGANTRPWTYQKDKFWR